MRKNITPEFRALAKAVENLGGAEMKKAAKWLRGEECGKLIYEGFCLCETTPEGKTLCRSLHWDDTPQGHDYWFNIQQRLSEAADL
jgi:hypothetical protein